LLTNKTEMPVLMRNREKMLTLILILILIIIIIIVAILILMLANTWNIEHLFPELE